MAYLDGFENDVFLSYAHIDNESEGTREKARWVSDFGDQLKIRLLKHMGETVEVWWDPKLDRSQLFDEVIEKAVRNSAIVVSLVSNAYIKRDYCKQELQWFAEQGNLKTASGHKRVFPVLLYRLPFDQWPETCKGVSGFEFFDAKFEDLSKPLDTDCQQFSDMLWKLVGEIAGVLNGIKQSRGAVAQASTPQPDRARAQGFRVFLGASSDELASVRNLLKKELQQQGIEVISKIPPPYTQKEHAEETKKAIEQADLCLHLLGNLPGTPIDEDIPAQTFPRVQAELALEHARSQLILMPESFSLEAVEEPEYKQFLIDLQERPRQSGRLQIVKAGRAQMLEAVVEAKKNLEDQAAKAAPGNRPPGLAFVDLHVKDLNYVGDLISYLAEKKISALTVPSVEQNPASGLAVFEQNLRNAELFIVVYGGVAREWVENRLIDGFKLITTKGLTTRMGVYVAPPDKPPEAVNFGFCDVMLNTKRFDPATMEPLFARAHRSAAQ